VARLAHALTMTARVWLVWGAFRNRGDRHESIAGISAAISFLILMFMGLHFLQDRFDRPNPLG